MEFFVGKEEAGDGHVTIPTPVESRISKSDFDVLCRSDCAYSRGVLLQSVFCAVLHVSAGDQCGTKIVLNAHNDAAFIKRLI